MGRIIGRILERGRCCGRSARRGLYIFVAIPMILSVVTGLFFVLILVPYWLMRGYKLSIVQKMTARFAIAGLVIPLFFLGEYAITRSEIVSQSMWLWPASFGLAALDRSATFANWVVVCGISIMSNVGVYCWLGLAIGSVWPKKV